MAFENADKMGIVDSLCSFVYLHGRQVLQAPALARRAPKLLQVDNGKFSGGGLMRHARPLYKVLAFSMMLHSFLPAGGERSLTST